MFESNISKDKNVEVLSVFKDFRCYISTIVLNYHIIYYIRKLMDLSMSPLIIKKFNAAQIYPSIRMAFLAIWNALTILNLFRYVTPIASTKDGVMKVNANAMIQV